MLPAIMAAARAYAPWIVLPFAVVIGGIGYTLEGTFSDKYTPWKKSAIGELNHISYARLFAKLLFNRIEYPIFPHIISYINLLNSRKATRTDFTRK